MPIPAFEVMPSPCLSFILPPLPLYLFASSSLTVFSSLSLFLLLVGDVCAAVSEDGLPTQEPAAEQWRSAQLLSLLSAPAAMLDPACCNTVSPPSHHLCSSIYLRREKEGGRAVASTVCFFSSEVRHRNERRCLSQKMQ